MALKLKYISRFFVVILFVASVVVGIIPQPTQALGGKCDYDFFENNTIQLYDPCDTTCAIGGGGEITGESIGGSALPDTTVKYLDAANIKSLAASNMDRYKFASEKTKVPWQAIAALHYREAKMNPNSSIFNGAPLGSGVNVDGQNVVADANQDAVNAAELFVRLAKGVYSVDVTSDDMKIENWGQAFLAYNRGYLYKKNGKTFDQSPYVMNGLDDSHMNMSWVGPPADPAVKGIDGNKAGALAVFQYLDGVTGGGCANSSFGNIIVDTAVKYARDTPATNGMTNPNLAKPEYREAIQQYNGAPPTYPKITDCGRFVSTVLHASGADPGFPAVTVSVLERHMASSSKWQAMGRLPASQMEPGDVVTASGRLTSGHILIYTGPIGPKDDPTRYVATDASFTQRIPSVRKLSGVTWMAGEPHYAVWRLK